MTRKDLSSVSKILLTLTFIVVLSASATGQRGPKKPPGSKSFLDTQWWLGIRAGSTFAHPVVGQVFSSFSPINYQLSDREKAYESWGNPGLMAGIDIIFYHKGFSIGLQPNYKKLQYGYSQLQMWNQSDGTPALTTMITIHQDIHYLEAPLMVKYDVIQSGKVRPFVQVGWQQSFLLDAQQEATMRQTDYTTATTQSYTDGSFRFGNKPSFRHFSGFLGGMGVNLDYFNIRTIVEANYQMGLNPITAKRLPYQENELVSLGVAQDELTLQQINISVSFVFPLRYIDNTFSPY